MRSAVILSILTCVLAQNQQVLNLYKQTFVGDGTYYGAVSEGTCSYTPPHHPPVATGHGITDLVALNRPQFLNSLACGMCFEVHGDGHGRGNDPITGRHLVFVKDLCPVCLTGAVDFAKDGDGRWNISIRAVQCPVGNTRIEYKFQGSNDYYLKLQVRNARIPVTNLEVLLHGRWYALLHTSDNFWTSNGSAAPVATQYHFPLSIRLTAANGHVMTDTVSHLVNEQVIHGQGIQVPYDSTLP